MRDTISDLLLRTRGKRRMSRKRESVTSAGEKVGERVSEGFGNRRMIPERCLALGQEECLRGKVLEDWSEDWRRRWRNFGSGRGKRKGKECQRSEEEVRA